MSKFQLLTGYINLGGSRDNVVYKGPDDPMTYPEALILQAIHGGTEHVHTLVEIGTVEREPADEYSRLEAKYGKIVGVMFPGALGVKAMPTHSPDIPTVEDVRAAEEAAARAVAERKAGKKSKTAKPATEGSAGPASDQVPLVPDLTATE